MNQAIDTAQACLETFGHITPRGSDLAVREPLAERTIEEGT